MKEKLSFLSFITIVCTGLGVGIYCDNEDKEYLEQKHQDIVNNVGPDGYIHFDSDDIKHKGSISIPAGAQWGWEKPNPNNKVVTVIQPNIQETLSDEEIRILREKQSFKSDGSYIYTPGRIVKTREEEIQDYIDKNGREIFEQLEDEYGN